MIEFDSLLQAQQFYLLCSSDEQQHYKWGYNGKYTLEYTYRLLTDKVISIECIEDEPEFVYDIETEDGTFQCGGGCIIVKNTDSIYTKFIIEKELDDTERLNEVARISEECSREITKIFKPPIELEFEKIMFPLILVTKKRYAYLGWESNGTEMVNKGIDIKGLQLIKREFCPFVKEIGMEILNRVFDRDPKGAEEVARNMISELIFGKVPIDKLIMTKRLNNSYKDKNKNGKELRKPPHWYLAQKIKKRDPMNAPKGGDRVSFVFIHNDDKHALQEERIEDPEYVKQHNIQIDTLYYLNRQVIKSLYTLFSCFIIDDTTGKPYKIVDNKIPSACERKIEKIWFNLVKIRENQIKRQHEITKYFKKK